MGPSTCREEHLKSLKNRHFDLLVIGGGATGAGIALDAASRGLRVALVERGDFSQETSSRSTKLFHGGVRYLEKAVLEWDRSQFHLVKKALRERATVMALAPHLTQPLSIVTPVESWWKAPYYWAGLKFYDLLAGRKGLGRSRWVSKGQVCRWFPKASLSKVCGGVLYRDGQFDDARFNLALVLTAAQYGARVANYCEVKGLVKEEGRCVGAQVSDLFSGESWKIRARSVVNATGAMVDKIRQLDAPSAIPLIQPSSGVHLLLDGDWTGGGVGLLIPETSDGRVLFLLPWRGKTLVGTTDRPAEVQSQPEPTDEEVEYLLKHIEEHLSVSLKADQVLAKWSGLRPLLKGTAGESSASLLRDDHLEVSDSGLMTVAGGKWTSYRTMAEEAVDLLVQKQGFYQARSCRTENLLLAGSEGYHPHLCEELQRETQLGKEICSHLCQTYGGKAWEVVERVSQVGANRLHEEFPFLEAEVLYSAEKEFVCGVDDVLMRRLRLAQLDEKAARDVSDRVRQLLEPSSVLRRE